MEQSDEELIARYVAGNEQAFEELAKRHLSTVYTFALRFVGRREEAEDITQETFLKAWRNIKKYRKETARFKTWLLRIARNTAIDFLRKKKHMVFSEFENERGENILAETLPDTRELPEETFAKKEASGALARALARLSAEHREVLLLYYTGGLTFEEIGHMLDEPANTTKSRHRRALIALRKLLPKLQAD